MRRIAHLSDIHFGGENEAAVAGARAWLAENPPDVTVISGDLTRFGHPDEFNKAAAFVGTLDGPIVITPGNHDTPWAGMWQRLTGPFADYQRHFGEPCGATWSGPGLSLVTANTARGIQIRLNWSKGEISRLQTSRALSAIATRPAESLGVVIVHHPLVEMAGGPMTARVRGGRAAAVALAQGGADLVLTGHIHAPFAMAFPYGDRRTYAVGAATLSVRERGAPAGFNVIAFDESTIDVTALGWSGSHYDVWRTWSFPRRGAPATEA